MKTASAHVKPLDRGGIEVAITVPTYTGDARLAFRVERMNDLDADGTPNGGDWAVAIPWPSELEDKTVLVPDDSDPAKQYAFTNGWAYLGSPDEEDDDED